MNQDEAKWALDRLDAFRELISGKQSFPEIQNDDLLKVVIGAIGELQRRAAAGNVAAADRLFRVAYEGAFQLKELANKKPDTIELAQRSPAFPMNVWRAWLKDEEALALFDKLKVGSKSPIDPQGAPASHANSPAKDWALRIIQQIRKIRLEMPVQQQATPGLLLTEPEKAAIALPELSRDTADQWFDWAKPNFLPETIHELPEWAFIQRDQGYLFPADKRHVIFFRIKQALKTFAPHSV